MKAKNINVGILIGEDLKKEDFELAIRDKYDVTDAEVKDILDNTTFAKRPRVLKGKKILFTDGGLNIKNYTLFFDKVYMFACGYKDAPNKFPDYTVLLDYRVYPEKIPLPNVVDYVKKINFDRYRPIRETKTDTFLLYGTKNCRLISDFKKHLRKNKKILAIVSEVPKVKIPGIEFVTPPVRNLFEKFDAYIYTEVPRHFDCSPRFIAECKFYNKKVFFDIDYMEEDLGLLTRYVDIENDFDSVKLKESDDILRLLEL
jgi:hypothetical protein